MKRFIRRVAANKRSLRIGSFSIVLIFSVTAYAVTRGPIQCDTCTFGGPASDAVKNAIQNYQPTSGLVDAAGDVYIVCNGTQCGQYVVSNDFRYNYVQTTPRGGGGGGGESGGGGGGAAGGGSVAPGSGGGGGVIIGPVKKKEK